jgi:capsule assembly protein Wzi/PAP2 superfamily protein
MSRGFVLLLVIAVLLLMASMSVYAQIDVPKISGVPGQSSSTGSKAADAKADQHSHHPARPEYLPPGEDPDNHLVLPVMRHIAEDQERFWTRPAHFKVKDLRWGLPLAGVTAGLIASDSWISKQIPDKPNQISHSKTFSNYAAYSLVGLGASSYLFGKISSNDHLAETGLLSGEAAIDSAAVAYLMKAVTERTRPYQDSGNGRFFQGGTSFPSEHSAVAWSVASIWAHEYPGKLSQTLAYGLASAVTVTRVTGQQHFGSDALIGSALGWYFARQVYRSHHDIELGGTAWGNLLPDESADKPRNPENMGSPYVPVDSWVYPIFDRMAALGYMHSGYAGMRPWTRMECARLVEEIGDNLDNEGDSDAVAQKLYNSLASEFAPETGRLNGAANLGASIDSVYTRSTEISGTPLRDGYHFGQTIINDYGRPYGEGFNNVSGITAHAVAGPFSIAVQAEYQHAPAVSSDPMSVLQATAVVDGIPVMSDGRNQLDRLHILQGTIAFTFHDNQISFGKQSLWLGPSESGSFLMSNNAEPIPMLRIEHVTPYQLPLLSNLIGPVQIEFFLGQLSGHRWEFCQVPSCQQADPSNPDIVGPNINPQPFIHGEKISFKPTENLEIGMGVTAMFGGPGLPVTWGNFLRTYYVHSPSAAGNPGKRTSEADFSYRVPGLRNWLTFYADTMVVDEISPIGSTRANVNPGLFISHFPKLFKLQLRAEGLNESVTSEFGPGFVYSDPRRYRNGYTNDGLIMGNAIGRAGRGEQGWLTYSFTPQTWVQLGYRLQEAAPKFVGGGRLADYSAKADMALSSTIAISASLQYEQWHFVTLDTNPRKDVTASFQVTFHPKR